MLKIKHTRQLTKEKSDTLLSPYVGITKSRRGARYRKTEAHREYHQAKTCLRKVFWLNHKSILERFPKNKNFRKSHLAVVWNEDTFRHSDHIAHEDNSCIATWNERQLYEKNWKFASNAQGQNASMTEKITPKLTRQSMTASERRTRMQLSDFTEPSDSPKTISRKAMEIVFLVHIIFVSSAWTGSQTWRTPQKWKAVNVSFFKKFRLQEMAILFCE